VQIVSFLLKEDYEKHYEKHSGNAAGKGLKAPTSQNKSLNVCGASAKAKIKVLMLVELPQITK